MMIVCLSVSTVKLQELFDGLPSEGVPNRKHVRSYRSYIIPTLHEVQIKLYKNHSQKRLNRTKNGAYLIELYNFHLYESDKYLTKHWQNYLTSSSVNGFPATYFYMPTECFSLSRSWSLSF